MVKELLMYTECAKTYVYILRKKGPVLKFTSALKSNTYCSVDNIF